MAIPKFFFYQNDKAAINKEIVLTDEQKFWREHTYRRFSLMKAARQMNNQEDNWTAWEKQYEAWRPPKGLNWQSNIVPPFTTSVVEAALAEMVDQNLMPMVGGRIRQDVPKATVMNQVKDYSWQVGYGPLELYKAIKEQLIHGTSFWQEYYLQEKQKVKFLTSYDPKTGREEYKEVEMLDFDDVYGECVNIWEIWFDPNARSVNIGPYKAQDAIRRYVMHIDTFRNTFVNSRWDKYKMAQYVKPSGDVNYYQFYKPAHGIDLGSEVEVLWHWIRQPDIVTITANDIPFYIGPKPYNHKKLPFGRGVDLLNSWSLYGKGEPQLLESIQDELTTNRRMRLDRQKLDIYKMIFVSNRETITENDLVPAPMKPIYVDDVQNVQAFEYGDINPSAYKEEGLLKEDGARVTGVDDRAQSVAGSARTATEAAILKDSTLKRLRTKIWLTSQTLLTEVIQLRVPNIIQFYQQPKIKAIGGDSAVEKWLKIKEVALEGRLIQDGNNFYEKEYRTIVTKNKLLERVGKGDIKVVDKRGDNFFMVTPDVLVPDSDQGFLFKLSAEPTVPLSRPLLQQKVGEFLQHPIVMAAFQSKYWSADKAADTFAEINDFDPATFLSEESLSNNSGQVINEALISPERMMEAASKENDTLSKGVKLPGTPFATPEHTMTHLEFLKSQKDKLEPTAIAAFYNHIMLEETAQKSRSMAMQGQNNLPVGGGGQESMRNKETAGIMGGEAKATNPNQQLGPENVPDLAGFMGFGPGR